MFLSALSHSHSHLQVWASLMSGFQNWNMRGTPGQHLPSHSSTLLLLRRGWIRDKSFSGSSKPLCMRASRHTEVYAHLRGWQEACGEWHKPVPKSLFCQGALVKGCSLQSTMCAKRTFCLAIMLSRAACCSLVGTVCWQEAGG